MNPNYHTRPCHRFVVNLVILAVLAAGAGALRAGTPERVTVVAYNLNNFLDPALGYPESKTAASRKACIANLAAINADIAVLLEVGGKRVAKQIAESLSEQGADYPFRTVVEGDDQVRQIAILSRFKPVDIAHETAATYKIGDEIVPVQRGFANCMFSCPNGYKLRIVAAHLKSKRYHPLGQTDMRRYESRQLRYLINRYILEDTDCNLLLLGDFNDHPQSSPLNTLFNRRRRPNGQLYDLRPVDDSQLSWTHYWDDEDIYSRIDYALVSQALLPEIDFGRTRIFSSSDWFAGSDHRPVIVTIRPTNDALSADIAALFVRNIRNQPPP